MNDADLGLSEIPQSCRRKAQEVVDTSLSCSESKPAQGRFRLSIRKRFSAQLVFGHWSRLLREVIAILSLADLKECLDSAPGTGWDFWGILEGHESVWMITVSHFQLRYSTIP